MQDLANNIIKSINILSFVHVIEQIRVQLRINLNELFLKRKISQVPRGQVKVDFQNYMLIAEFLLIFIKRCLFDFLVWRLLFIFFEALQNETHLFFNLGFTLKIFLSVSWSVIFFFLGKIFLKIKGKYCWIQSATVQV